MIVSTKGKRAADAVQDRYGKGFPSDLVKRTRAMLSAMDAAVVLEDLRVPPGNHLEALKGNRAGQHSVRINDQWRICFVWTEQGPVDVEIVPLKGGTMTLMQNPSPPGEVLAELYLEPLGMSAIELAGRLHVPRTRIERLVKGDTALTVDTALRLSTFFGNTPEFWMNLQRSYDLARARESVDVSGIVPLAAA